MKWQRNPDTIEFGIYAYKKKNTDIPVLVNIDIESGIPTDYQGWWLGPLELPTKTDNTLPCICMNCRCWIRLGKSAYGTCHRHPPIDNNWSRPKDTKFCFEFLPKIK